MKWFPGENYPAEANEWTVRQPGPRCGGRILNCTYAGYPSWYAKINTKVVVDADGAVAESDEGNNIFTKEISVSQPVAATAADLYVRIRSEYRDADPKGQIGGCASGGVQQGQCAWPARSR